MLPLPRAASRQLCTGKITGRALRQLPLVGKSVRRYKLCAHFHSERFDGLGTIAAEGTTHGNCQAVCGEKKKASALYGKSGPAMPNRSRCPSLGHKSRQRGQHLPVEAPCLFRIHSPLRSFTHIAPENPPKNESPSSSSAAKRAVGSHGAHPCAVSSPTSGQSAYPPECSAKGLTIQKAMNCACRKSPRGISD